MSRDSESEHDPGAVGAGAEVGEEYRHMSEEAYGEGPVGPMILDEAVTVDVSDVMTELADPEVVAEIVASHHGGSGVPLRETEGPLHRPNNSDSADDAEAPASCTPRTTASSA